MYRFFLAIRYLLSRPINLLGVAGVALGVWALIVVVSIFSGFLTVIAQHVRSAAADATVAYLPPNATWPSLRDALLADENVAGCAPRIVHFGLLNRPGVRPPPPPVLGRGALQGGDTPFEFVLGVDPALERSATRFGDWLTAVKAGHRVRDLDAPLQPIDGLPAILIGEERMEHEGLKPGDRLLLNTGRIVRNDGNQNLQQVTVQDPATGAQHSPVFVIAGAYRTQYSGYDGNNAFVHLDVLRELLGLPATAVQEIAVKVRDDRALEATAERLQRVVQRVLGQEFMLLGGGAVVQSWLDRHGSFLANIAWQRGMMKLILIVILVVAAVLMFATLSMMVTEKTGDIGILTALGGTRWGVLTVFVGCGLAITAAGILVGTATGCLSAIWLDEFRQLVLSATGVDLFPVKVYNLDRVPHEIDPVWLLQVAGMALAVGVVVSAIPAWRAARHDPLVSLRGI